MFSVFSEGIRHPPAAVAAVTGEIVGCWLKNYGLTQLRQEQVKAHEKFKQIATVDIEVELE